MLKLHELRAASAISAFWKIKREKTVWLIFNNMNIKKFAYRKHLKIFLEALFFQFHYKIFVIVSFDIIVLENFPFSISNSYFRITICNLHLCYTFCTMQMFHVYC